MDCVWLFYYLPWLYFSLQFFKAKVDQQECINGTITAGDFKGAQQSCIMVAQREIVTNNCEVEEQ